MHRIHEINMVANDLIKPFGMPTTELNKKYSNRHVQTLLDALQTTSKQIETLNFQIAYSDENLQTFNDYLEKKTQQQRIKNAVSGFWKLTKITVPISMLLLLGLAFFAVPLILAASLTFTVFGSMTLIGIINEADIFLNDKTKTKNKVHDFLSKNVTQQLADVIKFNKTITHIDLSGWAKFNCDNVNQMTTADEERIHQNLKVILNAKRYNSTLQSITFDNEIQNNPRFDKVLSKIKATNVANDLPEKNTEIQRHFVRDRIKQAIKEEIKRKPFGLNKWFLDSNINKMQIEALITLKKLLKPNAEKGHDTTSIKTAIEDWQAKNETIMGQGRCYSLFESKSSRAHFAEKLLEIADRAEDKAEQFIHRF